MYVCKGTQKRAVPVYIDYGLCYLDYGKPLSACPFARMENKPYLCRLKRKAKDERDGFDEGERA